MVQQKVLLLFSTLLLCISCGQQHSIEGNIKNLGNDTLYIMTVPISDFLSDEDSFFRDTVIATDSKFTYDPPQKEPAMMFINFKKGIYTRFSGGEYHPESQSALLFWKPDSKISIQGEFSTHSFDYVIKGDDFNYNLSINRRQSLENLVNADIIEIKLDTLMFDKNNDMDVSERDTLIKSLFSKRFDERQKRRDVELNYVLNNPRNQLSGFYMTQLQMDTVAKYYDSLADAVKNGLFKNMIEYKLKRYNDYTTLQKNKLQIREGKTAPDFTLQSISGEQLSLYSLDREFVVLDFWGSWCGWCIKGFPKMKEYYNKYKDRVAFMGIACRDTEEKWKKAVADNQLNWLHVINNTGNDIAVKYAVEAYPTKIIIDRDKKIVAVFQGESDDFYAKLDEVIKK
jgi:thiol-disulfide isomerase/thioredoxin